MNRVLSLSLAALALVLFLSQASLAADKVHEGTVVKAGDGKLTMTAKSDGKEHSHDIGKDVKITLDGKAAKLEDLKADFAITVTTDDKGVVTMVDAKSK